MYAHVNEDGLQSTKYIGEYTDDLYNLIDFSRGDKYKINKLSETGDASYKFFVELVEDIISKINKMPDKINDAFINN